MGGKSLARSRTAGRYLVLFFQAEDGIRDYKVTGVQTCALPIFVIGTVKGDIHDIGKNLVSMMMEGAGFEVIDIGINNPVDKYLEALETHRPDILGMRSEERRVGKECRSRWSPYH